MNDSAGFVERAERLIAHLAAEREVPEIIANRDYAIAQLRAMLDQVSSGKLPPRAARHPVLARMVVDQWPIRHALAYEVSEVEALYRRL